MEAETTAPSCVDPVQVEQVITNLLLNAAQASAEDGEIALRVLQAENAIEVHVSDTGGGIPDEVKDHVFDAFFTTRADGTGLGLSVSREIAHAHGGSLEFTSRPGATTFVLRLPAEKD